MGSRVLQGVGLAVGAGVVALLGSAGPEALLLMALLAAGVVAMALLASLAVAIVSAIRRRDPDEPGG